MVDAAGISVGMIAPLHAATLRYFDRDGPFAAAAAQILDTPLPAPSTAAAKDGGSLILAWLRPTETLLLSETRTSLADLEQRLAEVPGGHLVDLSGAVQALRLQGTRVAELLDRLGSMAVALPLNAARRGRLADVPVLALSIRAGEVLLVVERASVGHLSSWIEATLADWTDGAQADSRRP